MTTDRFIQIDPSTNVPTEVTPSATSAGSSSAATVVVRDANGKIDNTNLYDSNATTVTAGEAITGPALCYIDSSGHAKNADNTSMSKIAQGSCALSIGNGSTGVYVAGPCEIGGFSSLTQGARYFLSTIGGITTTPPAAGSGNVYQEVGFALNTTTLQFNPKQAIQR